MTLKASLHGKRIAEGTFWVTTMEGNRSKQSIKTVIKLHSGGKSSNITTECANCNHCRGATSMTA